MVRRTPWHYPLVGLFFSDSLWFSFVVVVVVPQSVRLRQLRPRAAGAQELRQRGLGANQVR